MTKDQLQQDVDFLVRRSLKASAINFGGEGRDTGSSSNSIVAIAYGLHSLKHQTMPGDSSDMMACERMWLKLPSHRRNGNALKAINAARNCNYFGKEN